MLELEAVAALRTRAPTGMPGAEAVAGATSTGPGGAQPSRTGSVLYWLRKPEAAGLGSPFRVMFG